VIPEFRLFRPEGCRLSKGPGQWISGWFVQQLVKLSIARIVSSPFYLTLDADVMCVRHTEYTDLVWRSPIAPCHLGR
jgi:hypothetical protein